MQEENKPLKLFDRKAMLAGVAMFVASLLFFGMLYGIAFGTAPSEAHAVAAQGSVKSIPPLWLLARYGWCAFLIATLCQPLLKGESQKHFHYFRAIRPLMVLQNLGVLGAVLVCAIGLKTLCPFLDRSWLYLFPLNGERAINIGLMPAFIRYVGLVFVGLLALSLPSLAHDEEVKYRQGTKDWKHGARRSLRFGLVHCFVGIPLYAGLALSLGGLWFTHQYFRGGVNRSTAHHLTYNLLIVVVLTVHLVANHIAF